VGRGALARRSPSLQGSGQEYPLYKAHEELRHTLGLLSRCKGEVATVADFICRHNGNILHADGHADEESGLFLMRVEFDPKDFDIDLSQKDLADFGRYFSPIAAAFITKWRLAQPAQRLRMIILVSKYDHCLVDLLHHPRAASWHATFR
jgi:formyltetrahydrofolate deformylase